MFLNFATTEREKIINFAPKMRTEISPSIGPVLYHKFLISYVQYFKGSNSHTTVRKMSNFG